MRTHRNPPLSRAGCDDCEWLGQYPDSREGQAALTKLRAEARAHARQHRHATWLAIEQITNYNARRSEP